MWVLCCEGILKRGTFVQNVLDGLLRYDGRQAQKNYLRYVEEGISQGRRPELVGGGLIRSLGGWSAVLTFRRRGEKQASDTRILGDSEFVQEVTSDLDNMVKKNLRLSGRQVDIVILAGKVPLSIFFSHPLTTFARRTRTDTDNYNIIPICWQTCQQKTVRHPEDTVRLRGRNGG
jgi:hypothetical protein